MVYVAFGLDDYGYLVETLPSSLATIGEINIDLMLIRRYRIIFDFPTAFINIANITEQEDVSTVLSVFNFDLWNNSENIFKRVTMGTMQYELIKQFEHTG